MRTVKRQQWLTSVVSLLIFSLKLLYASAILHPRSSQSSRYACKLQHVLSKEKRSVCLLVSLILQVIFIFMKTCITPVFLPGESHRQGSLAGYIQSMGSQELDTTQQLNHHHHTISYNTYNKCKWPNIASRRIDMVRFEF